MKGFMWLAAGTLVISSFTSCVSKKKMTAMKESHAKEMASLNGQLGKCGEDLNMYMKKLSACEQERENMRSASQQKDDQITDLRGQLADAKKTRDQQFEQVGNLTVMSKAANENMRATLAQLEKKDKYIQLLQQAKSKADSINLALAVNLKSALNDGLSDQDIEIKVDKTVVFINLSDKMLYQSGSSNLTPKAKEVLGKIAKIVETRKDIDIMVEGYTDNKPIATDCIKDNWDLSVKRATSVVRMLQNTYKVDPNKLIAAGRGEYNTLSDNNTADGRANNRRTRIILLPKLDQFYELMNPNKM
ncbi:MAG: flagellar motor protein MotB [Saprospiraceae bacterium]|nr:flagellar motor protein MotB [Saprospiraceae bacterium]MBK8848809.1 flagellar motor protein MotB [Saprospiraceae bacterium]MBL0084333.1 flagellar motor protein MotB [Saprospiraceae bacterium]